MLRNKFDNIVVKNFNQRRSVIHRVDGSDGALREIAPSYNSAQYKYLHSLLTGIVPLWVLFCPNICVLIKPNDT